ncbi:MAG: hypothetical protein M5U12_08555 [Verrucomicrobia bacterium]|nr:hypothetical protein [Verrucomicrobiota bacterium]
MAEAGELRVLGSDGVEVLTNVTRCARDGFGATTPQGMTQDQEGTVWITFGDGGLFRMRPEVLRDPDLVPRDPDALKANPGPWTNLVWLLGLRDGLPFPNTTAPSVDVAGDLWLGCGEAGAFRYDGQRFHRYGPEQGVAVRYVRSSASDRAGNVWFATTEGLWRYDGERWHRFGREDGLRTEELWRVMVARNGRIWVGSVGAGVAVYDPALGIFQTLSWQDGQGHDTANGLVEDSREISGSPPRGDCTGIGRGRMRPGFGSLAWWWMAGHAVATGGVGGKATAAGRRVRGGQLGNAPRGHGVSVSVGGSRVGRAPGVRPADRVRQPPLRDLLFTGSGAGSGSEQLVGGHAFVRGSLGPRAGGPMGRPDLRGRHRAHQLGPGDPASAGTQPGVAGAEPFARGSPEFGGGGA